MQEFVFSGKDLIEGSYGDVLQPFLLDGAVCADFDCGRWIQTVDAAPNDGCPSMDVPVDSSGEMAAFSADDDLGEAVVAGAGPLFTGRGAMDVSPSDELLLNMHEKLFTVISLTLLAIDFHLLQGKIQAPPKRCL